ncbi:MAG: twin-arginine translocase subunit TatC [Planctomycetota bacterium]|nr:twin-arginine translocase subunit TatC [Planctomycetota bacterium]MDA1179364.1 twin-arginine translocase subunit TatC [Planctomycetota bacterium]
MRQDSNDDLFESSKMTFGEHLEELRGSLVRALLGLAIGTVIGLLFATRVVHWIEEPLKAALDRFYSNQSIHQLEREYGKLDESLLVRIEKEKLTFERKYVERSQWRRLLGEDASSEKPAADPESQAPPVQIDTVQPLPTSAVITGTPNLDDLVPIHFWSFQNNRISAFAVTEVFMIWMKAGFVAGFILSSPWVFYQIWGFVAAGLYPHEKQYVYTFFPVSIGLFLSGAALAYFFVFSYVLDFLFGFNLMVNIDPEPRISEWLGFVLLLPIGFGLSFQLPLLMFVLERVGIVSLEMYLEKWRLAVLAIFFISMVLTPSEPISMLMMAVPLTFLYFGGIGMCKWMPRPRSPYGNVADPS